jgi:hypothetical protein
MKTLLGASWKTSLAGILGILGTVIPTAVSSLNGQEVNWGQVAIQTVISVGLMLAKDANVSHSPAPTTPTPTTKV